MATPYMNTRVILDGLMLRSRAIDCTDHMGLFASPRKRGENRVIPGLVGRETRPRVVDELRVPLPVRINGAYDQDNNLTSDPIGAMYGHLREVRVTCDGTGVKPLVFLYPGGLVGTDCQVEEVGAPVLINPHVMLVVIDLTLPDGPLELPS